MEFFMGKLLIDYIKLDAKLMDLHIAFKKNSFIFHKNHLKTLAIFISLTKLELSHNLSKYTKNIWRNSYL